MEQNQILKEPFYFKFPMSFIFSLKNCTRNLRCTSDLFMCGVNNITQTPKQSAVCNSRGSTEIQTTATMTCWYINYDKGYSTIC